MSTENTKLKAIIYTDGSCLPPRGSFGGGAHGYLFDDTCYRKNNDKPNHYTVTTDGYLEKDQLAAYAEDKTPKELKPLLHYNAAYPYGREGTNNRAELLAMIDTVCILCDNHPIESILILTDSMYVISIYNAVVKDPKGNTWLDSDRPNLDLWTMLSNTLSKYKSINIKLGKVIAHGTAVGNNVADRLAYVGREMAGKGHNKPVFKFYKGKYWTDKPVPHPLLNFKQLYFNVGILPDVNESLYAFMDYPKDVELGKKSSEPLYGISIFKEPVNYVDSVINAYLEGSRGNQYLTTLDLRVLYTQEHYKMSELLGTHTYDYSRNKLLLMGETPIATPISPPGLAQNALAKTLIMYTLYKHYLQHGVSDDGVTVVIDITDQLYDINDKGKYVFKYLQNIVGPEVQVNIDGKSLDMTLVYGKDTLTRNQLKKLEVSKPKILLLFKRGSKSMLEYYSIIDTEEASGIYGNYYINKIYS